MDDKQIIDRKLLKIKKCSKAPAWLIQSMTLLIKEGKHFKLKKKEEMPPDYFYPM